MEIEEFGKHLLDTNDLDPVYVALVRAALPKTQLHRWLLSYTMFYHCGVASYMSELESADFWEVATTAAINEQEAPNGGRWPRGSERRHYRGQQAVRSVEELRERYPAPEDFMTYVAGAGGSFHEVSKRAQSHRGYGPWIGFKLADLVDRVLGIPVEFDNAAVFMFKDPEKSAMMLWERRQGQPNARPKREAALKAITDYLLDYFKDYDAPPLYDRKVNIQEVETILCKWKSHMNGHYPEYNDIDDLLGGLEGWGTEWFRDAMPKRGAP